MSLGIEPTGNRTSPSPTASLRRNVSPQHAYVMHAARARMHNCVRCRRAAARMYVHARPCAVNEKRDEVFLADVQRD